MATQGTATPTPGKERTKAKVRNSAATRSRRQGRSKLPASSCPGKCCPCHAGELQIRKGRNDAVPDGTALGCRRFRSILGASGRRLKYPLNLSSQQTCFHTTPHAFTDHLIKFGMYRNTGINTSAEKSDVTGPDNFITCFDTFNFHPSYREGGPSFCE